MTSEHVAAVAKVFDSLAGDYDRMGFDFFVPLAQGLVDALDPRPGEVCADLGCGPGTASVLLARRVVPDGKVVGLDVSAAMIDRARSECGAGEASHDTLTFVQGDAQQPDLPERSHDLVASALVLFFLPDPQAALSHWVRLLKPGGRLGVSTFGPAGEGWNALSALLHRWMPAADPKAAEVSSLFGSDEQLERALQHAGATTVSTSHRRISLPFDGVPAWERFSRSVGQRAAWMRLSRDDLSEVRSAAEQVLAQHGPDAYWQDVRYTIGHRPPASTDN
ncbi:class I SAM-dependent methyltransferase [Aestuariimicrobium sp. T2.26MG-19.2B]|uniref:class I SAM-dependent methyltransferase n=1 Tax=Aestuariimicrobium sp. T2.26MG-19.2B TaxID=3040679 RepID=UPI00247760E3|nr:methyltransferase domain-containing protein [Aestuariimicrobium sp. T2.26MG-19.2B]CAI9409941.1 Aklanonic acid methyltransferase DnrC [Aestuariimicrobium sp. T2.26MG-19.2B]